MNTNGTHEGSLKAIYVSFFSVIVAFFFVIFPVSQVRAETAWIKWEHSSCTYKKVAGKTINEGKPIWVDWIRREAFPNYKACMSAIHAEVKSICGSVLKDDKDNYYCHEKDTSVQYGSDVVEVFSEYYCYPDTVDPRK